MSQATVGAVPTSTRVGKIGALMRMEFGARVSLLTVAHASKLFAVERTRLNANMSERAAIMEASASHEVCAGRCVVRGGDVRQRTHLSHLASVLVEPVFAYGLLVWVVDIRTAGTGTNAYGRVRGARAEGRMAKSIVWLKYLRQ